SRAAPGHGNDSPPPPSACFRVGRNEVAAIRGRLGIRAALEIQELDTAKLDRVALALQRDVTLLERLAVPFHLRAMARHDAAAEDDAAVLEHRLAVDVMHDPLAAEHERLGDDPAVAVDRRRGRADAMRLVEP